MNQPDNGRAFRRLISRLSARAAEVGAVTAENRLRQRQGDASRWRDARLLWPLAANPLKED